MGRDLAGEVREGGARGRVAVSGGDSPLRSDGGRGGKSES